MVLTATVGKSTNQHETENMEPIDEKGDQQPSNESLSQDQPKKDNHHELQPQNRRNNPYISSEGFFRHPLQNSWTLWFLENDKTKPWEELLNVVTTFDTVEGFWSVYRHVRPASQVKIGSDYSLFKKGIRPMWEDDANKNGGRWVIVLVKTYLLRELDRLWCDVLLCLIGETFDNADQICGAVVNVRHKGAKISVWTSDGKNKEAVMEIGRRLRQSLNIDPCHINFVYQLHKDVMMKQGSSTIKTTYMV